MKSYIVEENADDPRYVGMYEDKGKEWAKIVGSKDEAYPFDDFYEAIASMAWAAHCTRTNWRIKEINLLEA